MYYYNKVVSRVVTTEEGFRMWFAAEVAEHNNYLSSKNCCGCHEKLEENWNSIPMPDRYPAFAQLSFKGGWKVFPTYVYPDQIMELIGLKGLIFSRPALENGLMYATHSDEYGPSGYVKITMPAPVEASATIEGETELVSAGSIEDRTI